MWKKLKGMIESEEKRCEEHNISNSKEKKGNVLLTMN